MDLLPDFAICACDWWRRYCFDYPSVFAFAAFAAFAFGACLGSFLNVCIWRMPRRESVVTAPSHCTKCGSPIRWYDNLPVLSYLVLRGRCRACGETYSPRYFIVEFMTGALFVAIMVKVGLARQEPGAIGFYALGALYSIGAAWIDAEHRIIPDKLTYPVMLLALALSGVFPEARGCASRPEAMLVCLVSGALPGAFLGIFALLGRLLCRREVMGHGDVKFACASGMLFGAAGAFFSLLVGAAAGLFYGVVSCRLRGERIRDRELAFGPFLALGALIWIFFGTAIFGLLGGK